MSRIHPIVERAFEKFLAGCRQLCERAVAAASLILAACLSSQCPAALYEFDMPEVRGFLPSHARFDLGVKFSAIDSARLELVGHQAPGGLEPIPCCVAMNLPTPSLIEISPPRVPAPGGRLHAILRDFASNEANALDFLIHRASADLPSASGQFSATLLFDDIGGGGLLEVLNDGTAKLGLSAFARRPQIIPVIDRLPLSVTEVLPSGDPDFRFTLGWPGGMLPPSPVVFIDSAKLYVTGQTVRTPEPASWRVLMAGMALGLPVLRHRHRRLRLSGAAAPTSQVGGDSANLAARMHRQSNSDLHSHVGRRLTR